MQLHTAIEQYLLDCKVNNISKNTLEGYDYWLKSFYENVGDMPIEEMSANTIRSFQLNLMERGNLHLAFLVSAGLLPLSLPFVLRLPKSRVRMGGEK